MQSAKTIKSFSTLTLKVDEGKVKVNSVDFIFKAIDSQVFFTQPQFKIAH